jgi:hypothetical protein
MNKKRYCKPKARVITLKYQTALLSLSPGGPSVTTVKNSVGIDYVDEIDNTYSDN